MRLKLTHKDLILIAGIAVAVIITLTTLVLDYMPVKGETSEDPQSRISFPSPTVLINKIGQGILTDYSL